MKPRPATAAKVERLTLSLGFQLDRSKGSHRIYKNSAGRTVVIPFHPGDITTGTLGNIIGQLGITVEQFNENV